MNSSLSTAALLAKAQEIRELNPFSYEGLQSYRLVRRELERRGVKVR